jgi:large subunit ribosomal protein L22
MLGRQISGKPVDLAILQMQFSEKRASKRIKSMLTIGKHHAVRKGIDSTKMIICTFLVITVNHMARRLSSIVL